MRRVFITSPPGCNRHATASAIAENFEWKFISASDAILAEGEKDTLEGAEILKATKKFTYVDDEIVIKLVQKEIQEAENKTAAARKVLAHIGERVRGRKKANGEGREAKESQQMSEIVREITDMRVLTV